MSELTSTQVSKRDFRIRLLATVSAVALTTYAFVPREAKADGPTLWIELGGTFSHLQTTQDAFLPPFSVAQPRPPFAVVFPDEVQKAPATSWDGSAKISLQPARTDLVLSIGILYGKTNRSRSLTQQTLQTLAGVFPASEIATSKNGEIHTVMDFQAGKDVGLGVLGIRGKSLISLGMRYAQFKSKADATIVSQPTNGVLPTAYNRFYADFSETRKFAGVGPSLSWDASANLIGDQADGEVAFDWGVNGAVLFGRQTVHGLHQTTDNYFYPFKKRLAYQHIVAPDRSKGVAVPNLGGFAGVGWHYPNGKVMIGYRADFFFGAMDGGIDTAHRENVGFYGPFASISIGLGG